MGRRLLLFDIDGTLLDTGGAGMAALRTAAVDVFGTEHEVPAFDLAGSTDSGIVRGLFEYFGEPFSEARVLSFYEVYLGYLAENLGRFEGRLLDGVGELLVRLGGEPGCAIGLLTGNIAEGAAKKVRHFGIEAFFGFGAYGDDHHDRNRLGPVALGRAREVTGEEFLPEDSVVIGDTPKDIWCGEALGAKTVAVATGRFSSEELAGHGADVVFADLGDVEVVVERLLG